MTPVAISLWQPWASLWVHGLKRNETRSWRHNRAGQWVLVHASVNWDANRNWLCAQDPFWDALETVGFDPRATRYSQILGMVKLAEPWRVPGRKALNIEDLMDTPRVSKTEAEFGDYSWGRWVWPTEEPRLVFGHKAVACPGRQSFFRPNDDVLREVAGVIEGMNLVPADYGF